MDRHIWDERFAEMERRIAAGEPLLPPEPLRAALMRMYAELQGASNFPPKHRNLTNVDLSGQDLAGADFANADLSAARLDGCDLTGANLERATLVDVSAKGAILKDVWFLSANLSGADLSSSNITGSFLGYANLNLANLTNADISDSFVFGVSVWGTRLDRTRQNNLLVTRDGLTTDNIQLAQFLHLLVENPNLRNIIGAITAKVVLILGNFCPERKTILDAIREKLRALGYVPVLFDFERPSSRDITETVSTLAHMAKFVIADITDAKSIPQELMAIVPALPSVPVQPLLLASQREYGMFEHFRAYPWVLPAFVYEDQDGLMAALNDKVVGPAEKKATEQTKK